MKIVARAPEPAVSADRLTEEAGAEAPPAGSPPAAAQESAAVGEAARAEVRRLLAAWRLHEGGARLGVDPEELHQLRVTARRLDATLALFKEHLPAALVRSRKTAKSLLRSLGATRDLDVQLAGLAAYRIDLPEEERSALEPLSEHLRHARARAHARMVRALDSEATRRWLQTLAAASESAPAQADASAVTVAAAMAGRVRRRFRRLRKAVRRLRPGSSMDDYHKVRRRAKQLRYALESGVLNYGKPAEEMLKALRRLQDRLGAQQDAYMARSHLTALAADPACALPPATLFLMGKLAEHHSRVSAEARGTVTRCWRKVRGRRWKALRARLREFEHPDPRDAAPASHLVMADGAVSAPQERPLSH
ncbi:MAG TPA: CHAD domain-containing protein [Steroidobacteraceae bacterium]|nr:CHAD domain-containing protein [Steroidobacteraceae bacterium]